MNEQSIFLAALDIPDPAQRADYLDRSCNGDPALRHRVEGLLAAHERSGEFLDVPALKQMAAGGSGNGNSDGETSADLPASQREIDLAFLQPSTAAGSLGRLAHYEVREVIGRGGCGIVLKAFDEKLERIVAIKVMAPELAATSPARKRFLREARATAAIRHENVVNIYAVEEQPLPFLVMEYIDGETLQQRLDRTGPLDVRAVLRIGQQIAGGLAAAHAKGLIHRDIKPGNILLENGTDHLKITDFGLARSADDASMTQSGVIAGTPLYMSPEQAQARDIDHRSDLFSLGSVLYVMCSGRPPFRAATSIAVLRRVVEDQPRPIQGIIPEVPAWLVAIIARLHAKAPEDRFATAQEVGDLLGRCLSELEQHGRLESVEQLMPWMQKPAGNEQESAQVETAKPEEPVTPAPASLPARSRRHRWVAAAAMILVLLSGLGMTEATGLTNVRGTIIRLFSPDGTLVVEVDDPGVSVTIDGEEIVITGTGAKEIRLKPGQYKLLATKDGNVVRQELVTVTQNGRQVVRVSKEAGPAVGIAGSPKTADSLPARYTNSVGMEFALIPRGKGWLGGGSAFSADYEVEFKDDYYLGVYEVTQQEWQAVMGSNPSHFSRNNPQVKGISDEDVKRFPVESVPWHDAQRFLEALNKRVKEDGWIYRLPTRAEWEYACRGGPLPNKFDYTFNFYFEEPSQKCAPGQANCFFGERAGLRTCRVGSFKPNRLGLYDMHGNVWEWTDNESPPGPRDPEEPSQRHLLGGSFWEPPVGAWARNRCETTKSSRLIGLRVARVRVAAALDQGPIKPTQP
jgi:serine/threonine protein kinase/formylglycine-generating enzyme required for sulfatase activity